MRLLFFATRRLLLLIPTLFGVTVVTFVLVRVLPGDPIATILGQSATQVEIDAARARFGLDRPLLVQYSDYLSDLMTGDLGTSIQSGGAVSTEIIERIGPTLELVACGLLVALVAATVLGIWSALRVNSPQDHTIRVGALVGNALPDFWVGLLLILVVYSYLGWAPAPSGRVAPSVDLVAVTGSGLVDSVISGNWTALVSVLQHLALPVTTLAITVTAPLLRSVRASALEVRRSEAFATAKAHGLPTRRLIGGYLVRPTMAQLPTLAALIFGFSLGSAVLVEVVFSWQGLGQWALRGLLFRDYPVVQAAVVVIAFFYVLVFAIADVVHAVLDPRVRI